MLGIPHHAHCLALLPGSRGAEVKCLSADFLKTAPAFAPAYPRISRSRCRWRTPNAVSSLSV
ncbi:hypothetical protein ACNKHV_01175 [Shigella flexneri]